MTGTVARHDGLHQMVSLLIPQPFSSVYCRVSY
jgi:hypothetical protein